ncbi:MAG TPA: hypothetical protein VNO26_05310 [Candidatus Limnocylindria bacterium]|nr:hypothetical protein [Candidatus Limnocylindria bacterium]
MAELPPCGIYRTTRPLGDDIPAGRLVYFHNHGDPGPGVYLPAGWSANRASWDESGHTIPSDEWAASLVPLRQEGFYRVTEAFTCCEQRCRIYEPDLLVQLGYDADGQAILFVPEWTEGGLALPELGLHVDESRLAKLAPLTVAEPDEEPPSGILH